MKHLILTACLFAGSLVVGAQDAPQPGAQLEVAANVIRTVALDPAKPLLIPTHPRVATTIRFPGAVGAPFGKGFTEDPSTMPGEYCISWSEGERYMTITPLDGAGAVNLNVPYKDSIYVLYFYPVEVQTQALACLNLVEQKAPEAGQVVAQGPVESRAMPAPAKIEKLDVVPESQYIAPTASRLMGLLDKVKLLHGTASGSVLAGMCDTMQIDLAVSSAETQATPRMSMQGVKGVVQHAINDAGLYQIILVRAMRDRRMNCVGFACIIRNTSPQELAFDVNSFVARSGTFALNSVLADAPAIVKPGEQRTAYFIVQPPKTYPVQAVNEWRISADLVSPRLNPGAAIVNQYARGKEGGK